MLHTPASGWEGTCMAFCVSEAAVITGFPVHVDKQKPTQGTKQQQPTKERRAKKESEVR
jgi:hypothetical protein